MKSVGTTFRIIMLLFVLPEISGCCGIGAGPTQKRLENWLAKVPPGSSGDDMYNLLKEKGFAPTYSEDRREILGTRQTDSCCLLADWLDVQVELDASGHVVSSSVGTGQNYP